MAQRQLRATFALRYAVQLVLLGAIGLVLLILGMRLSTTTIVVGVLLLAILEPLAWLAEHLLVRRAARPHGAIRSAWYVDLDDRRRDRMRRFLNETPTLR